MRKLAVSKKSFVIVAMAAGTLVSSMKAYCALPKSLKQEQHWELKANSANKMKDRKVEETFPLYHYDIPTKLLSKKEGFLLDVPQKIHDALFFKKGSEEYVRWIINPEDKKYHVKIKKILEERGLDSAPHHFFTGHLTASRSIYIEAPNPQDPDHPTFFSGKVSTGFTGGKWKYDKGLDADQVADSMISAEMAIRVKKNGNILFPNLKLLEEPVGLFLDLESNSGSKKDRVQQGFIIRDLTPIISDEYHYLPGFSALHETEGVEIAKLNGSNDPASFWMKHYIQPLGKAAAELSSYLGIAMTSAHNQQWLIELDKNMKPTGKIVLRDFNDSNVVLPFYEQSTNPLDKKVLQTYGRHKKYVRNYLLVQLGLFHGTEKPSWITKNQTKEMSATFFESFEKRFSQITGVSQFELSRKEPTLYYPPRYSLKSYRPSLRGGWWSLGWRRYFAVSPCFRGGDFIVLDGQVRDCKDILKLYAEKSKEPYDLRNNVVDLACKLEKQNENPKDLKALMKQYPAILKHLKERFLNK